MWTLLVLKVIASFFLVSAVVLLSDWLFTGSSWARKYYAHAPNIWRPMESGDPRQVEHRIVRTSLFLTGLFSFAFILFYFVMRPGSIFGDATVRAIAISLFLWLLIPVPLLISQHQFVKYHRATTLLQLGNWLTKLVVASLCMTYLF